MKKMVQMEIDVCDVCGENSAYRYCRICGKYVCHECEDEHLKQLQSELGFESSEDTYCTECVNNPPEKFKVLMTLYAEMNVLRQARKNFYEEEKRKSSALSIDIKKLKRDLFG